MNDEDLWKMREDVDRMRELIRALRESVSRLGADVTDLHMRINVLEGLPEGTGLP